MQRRTEVVTVRTRGLSLIELMLGLTIVFAAVCLLGALIVTTSRYSVRIHERAVALELARHLAEGSIFEGSTVQSQTVPGYTTAYDYGYYFPPFDPVFNGQMDTETITVTMPSRQTIEIQRGSRSIPRTGCCVSDGGIVAYGVGQATNTVRLYNDQTANPLGDYPPLPMIPSSRGPYQDSVSSLTCDAAFSVMYVQGSDGIYTINNPR